jgi:polyisoprenoid-binding protein YceI
MITQTGIPVIFSAMKIKVFFAILPYLFFSGNLWQIKSSTIEFKIKNAGMNIQGCFSGLEAEIQFNPLKPEKANILASVKAKTIDTGNDTRDNHLRKPDYFDSDKYPKITLQSTKIEKTGPISFKGYFKLTIKGITRDVVIPFNFIRIVEKTEIKGSFTLNRRDYNIGSKSLSLSDNVTVYISIDLKE